LFPENTKGYSERQILIFKALSHNI